jgi:hypothetical protein
VLAVAQILGGTALLSGLYFTWRTLQVNREGQITERFTRAIDQLGKVEDGQKLFEIRVGGIYALERIARESEEDYWPIMEILTAYVRQNAPLPPKAGRERTEDATDEQRAEEGSGGKSETAEPSAPDPDIQAIMTILRRRKRYFGRGEPERLNLRETNLSRANLSRVDLTGADLRGAILDGAILHQADLRGAFLDEAYLTGAYLYQAYLTGAYLREADLRGAILDGAVLSEELGSRGHRAREEIFGEELGGADLRGTHFFDAALHGADLRGADLRGAHHLDQYQVESTHVDENTQLPPDLKPPITGPYVWHRGRKIDEQPEED